MTPKSDSQNPPIIRLTLNPNLVAGGLAAGAIFLGIAYATMCYLQMRLPEHPLYALPRFFSLLEEGNLPTYFSALCLLTAGLLSLLTATADHAQQKAGWLGLGLGFTYLSIDEAAQIHDAIINYAVNSAFGAFETSAFYYGWVVAAMCAVSVFAILYLGFLSRLPRNFAAMLIVSGIVYIGGAVGMEMIEAHFKVTGHTFSSWFPGRDLVEELAEMLGIILFIHTVMRYLTHLGCSWNLSWSQSKVRNL